MEINWFWIIFGGCALMLIIYLAEKSNDKMEERKEREVVSKVILELNKIVKGKRYLGKETTVIYTDRTDYRGQAIVHPEIVDFGPWRRSRIFKILDIARYACGFKNARALPGTKIYYFRMDTS